MKLIRPALLVLLTYALAGLGVPAGLDQGKAAPSTSKKKSGTAATGKSAGATRASATKKSSGKSSGKASTKSSRRSRRQPGQKAPTNDRISEIQAALARDGSYQGLPSGKWDDDTSSAMRKFQASHGLNPSGKLDARTLQRLGLGSQTAGLAAPTPPPGATSRLTSSTAAPSMGSESSRQP
jgi:peptidoglycan hydrolase-like protein with peptidoglycan-binding domain